jgi:hypothetical protein
MTPSRRTAATIRQRDRDAGGTFAGTSSVLLEVKAPSVQVPRIAPQHPLELLAGHRSARPGAPGLLGAGDELGTQALIRMSVRAARVARRRPAGEAAEDGSGDSTT